MASFDFTEGDVRVLRWADTDHKQKLGVLMNPMTSDEKIDTRQLLYCDTFTRAAAYIESLLPAREP